MFELGKKKKEGGTVNPISSSSPEPGNVGREAKHVGKRRSHGKERGSLKPTAARCAPQRPAFFFREGVQAEVGTGGFPLQRGTAEASLPPPKRS